MCVYAYAYGYVGHMDMYMCMYMYKYMRMCMCMCVSLPVSIFGEPAAMPRGWQLSDPVTSAGPKREF